METIESKPTLKESDNAPTVGDILKHPKREINLISKENEAFILDIIQAKDNIILIAKKKEDIKALEFKKNISIKRFP